MVLGEQNVVATFKKGGVSERVNATMACSQLYKLYAEIIYCISYFYINTFVQLYLRIAFSYSNDTNLDHILVKCA